MKLSKRLETVASFVPKGSNIADIGTDHGYVPICLVENKTAVHALAMDVRLGPLLRAKAHVQAAGLDNRIEVRLSDGLKKLKPEEADCVIMAGMGGELMIHILEDGRHMWESIRYWVLSPQSELEKVRHYLEEESFSIVRETMMKEDGKYYTVMGIRRSAAEDERRHGDGWEPYYRYGKLLLEEKSEVLMEYLKKEEAQLKELLDTLKDCNTPGAARRADEVKRELSWNQEAQDEMR